MTSDADRQALIAIHAEERQAHLEGDAHRLAEMFADEVWEAGRGQLQRISRSDIEERFERYFGSVRYSVWDDLQPPHVAVSDDGMRAWLAVHIEATLTEIEDGSEHRFESAWIATYEKHDGRWLMVGISSSVRGVEAT